MQDEPLQSPDQDRKATPSVASAPANLPPPAGPAVGSEPANPAWAEDLRKLYNAVVEEPLPASLIDLLGQLDAED